MSVTDPAAPPAPPPPRAKSAKLLAVLTVVVAFAVGVIVGAFGFWGWIVHHHGGRAPFFSDLGEHRIVRHLDHELNLTPAQHDAIVRIVHAHRQRIDGIFSQLRPQIRQEFDQANAEIEKILTPEQRAKFERMRMRPHSRRHTPAESSPAGPPTP